MFRYLPDRPTHRLFFHRIDAGNYFQKDCHFQKALAALQSYWNKYMAKMLENSKDLVYTETTVKILSALNEQSLVQLENLAVELFK